MQRGEGGDQSMTIHDDQMERLVLGAIVAEHSQSPELLVSMTPDDFFSETHRKLFRIAQGIHSRGGFANVVSIFDEMQGSSELEGRDLYDCLAQLGDGIHKGGDFTYAARKLRQDAIRRAMLHLFENLSSLVQQRGDSTDQLLHGAILKLSEFSRSIEDLDDPGVSFFDAGGRSMAELSEKTTVKIYSGISELDAWIGGFRPGELIVLTAETGVGKTLLSQQVRRKACRTGHHSLFCSAEMKAEHLMRRELAVASGVEPYKLRRDDLLTGDDWQALTEASVHQCKFCRILDGELEISRIWRVARRMKSKTGLDAIILDYDELITAPGKDENEQLRVITRTAKSMGMELGCPVFLISQLRKEYGQQDKGEDRPPTLSRIYGSGAKSKHASIIIYAHRKWEDNLDGIETQAKIWVLKNRDGRTGPIDVIFNIRKLAFQDGQAQPAQHKERNFSEREQTSEASS